MTRGNAGAIHRQHGVMAPSPSPQPLYEDYAGRPLAAGDRVTYIYRKSSQPWLSTATIALLARDEICLDSGRPDHNLGSLTVIKGEELKAHGAPKRYRFDQMALRGYSPAEWTEEQQMLADTIERIRQLPNQPEAEDANNPYSEDYLRGYRHAMNAAQRAVDNPPAETLKDRP